jgi:hypothetical protein
MHKSAYVTNELQDPLISRRSFKAMKKQSSGGLRFFTPDKKTTNGRSSFQEQSRHCRPTSDFQSAYSYDATSAALFRARDFISRSGLEKIDREREREIKMKGRKRGSKRKKMENQHSGHSRHSATIVSHFRPNAPPSAAPDIGDSSLLGSVGVH